MARNSKTTSILTMVIVKAHCLFVVLIILGGMWAARNGLSPKYEVAEAVHSGDIDVFRGMLALQGRDPNIPDEFGEFPLTVAIRNHRYDIAELLLKHGANPEARNRYGETVRDIFGIDSQEPIQRWLLRKSKRPQ